MESFIARLYSNRTLFNGGLWIRRCLNGFEVSTSKYGEFVCVLAQDKGIWYVNEEYMVTFPYEAELLFSGLGSYEVAPASKVTFIAKRRTGAEGYDRRYMQDGDVRKWKNSLL